MCKTNVAARTTMHCCQGSRRRATSYISATAMQSTAIFPYLRNYCRRGADNVSVHNVANHCAQRKTLGVLGANKAHHALEHIFGR